MANFEVLSLDPTTPQIRAPGAGDGYSVPRDMTFATGTTLNAPTTVVSVNTATDALRITQVGSGNALVVEDSANPDATPTVIDASGNVGIGTTSPGSLYAGANNLVVGGGSGGTGMTIYSGTAGVGRLFFADGTSGADAYRGWVEYSHSTNNMTFGTNGTTKATLDTSGNLGLGVTPAASAAYRNVQVGNAVLMGLSSEPTAYLNSNAVFNSGWKYITTNTASRYEISDNHYWYTAPSGTAGNAITFTERMRLTSAGNLGIGTTSPQTLLHIAANNSSSTSDTPGATIRLEDTDGSVAADQPIGKIEFYANDGTTPTVGVASYILAKSAASNGGANLMFATAAAGSLATERMRITSAGELLVGGTTSVQAAAGVITSQTSGGGYFNCFRNDTSIVTGNDFGGLWWYGNDTTSNTPTAHAWVQAVASGDHAAGDNPTDIVFATTPDGTETVAEAGRITQAGSYVLKGGTTTAAAGVGIIFPATQVASADANSLDDYEEGTFTPVIEGSTSAGTGTYVSRVARYTKVGRLVSVQVYMSWSAHTGTGDMRLAGLPFTTETGTNSAADIGYAHNIALTANNVITAYTAGNVTYINVYQYPVGGGASTAVPIDTAGEIVYSVTYVATT